MVLDNQQQKNLLINIIRNTQLQGRYRDLKNDIILLDNLLQAIQNAEIAKEGIMESTKNVKAVEANNIKKEEEKINGNNKDR